MQRLPVRLRGNRVCPGSCRQLGRGYLLRTVRPKDGRRILRESRAWLDLPPWQDPWRPGAAPTGRAGASGVIRQLARARGLFLPLLRCGSPHFLTIASNFPGATGREIWRKFSTGKLRACFVGQSGRNSPWKRFGVLGYAGGQKTPPWAAKLKDCGGV